MRTRRLWVLFVVLAMVAAACSSGSETTTTTAAPDGGETTTTSGTDTTAPQDDEEPEGEARNEIVVVQSAEPIGFDPTQFSSGNHAFLFHLYDTLVRVGPDGLPYARLAEEWSVSDDGLQITFRLRSGPTFHDGSSVTADDVVYSYEYTTDPDNGTNLGGKLLAAVEGVEAVDDQTVVFNLLRPTPGFFDIMDVFFVLNEDAIDTILEQGAGSGPYTVESNSPGESFSLIANPNYWEDGVPATERITVRVVSDQEAQLSALLAGQADIIYQASPILATQVEATPGFRVDRFTLGANTLYFGMNVTRPPFDNKLVRQAVAHAVNRQALMAVTYPGDTSVAACQPFPPTSFWHTEGLESELPTCTFDLDRARELLAEAGFPDGFATSVNVSGNYGPPGTPDMAQILQQDLAQIGIELDIRVIEGATAREQLLGSDFDTVLHTYSSSGADPGFNHPGRTFGPMEPNNAFMQFTSPEYVDIVTRAGSELDRDVRKELYADMSRLIADESFIILLGYTYVLFLTNEGVEGIVETQSGYPDLSKATVSG